MSVDRDGGSSVLLIVRLTASRGNQIIVRLSPEQRWALQPQPSASIMDDGEGRLPPAGKIQEASLVSTCILFTFWWLE